MVKMERHEQDFDPPTKPRVPSWKNTIRKSLGCGPWGGKSRDPIRVRISKPYPLVDHAQEKAPAVADEVDRVVQRRADRAHQDVLETLRSMAASSSSGPGGEQPPRGPSSDAVSDVEPDTEQMPSPPRLGAEAARKQQQHQLRCAVLGPPQPPTPSPPPPALKALLYFTLERPDHGGFVRHYRHPLPLDLTTPRALALSVRTLRGYLTQQPRRFFGHFDNHRHNHHHRPRHTDSPAPPRDRHYHHRHDDDDDDDDDEDNEDNDGKEKDNDGVGIVINAPQLFSPTAEIRAAVERTWGRRGGPPLARAWVDAREEAFAPALVGLLRELAVARAARWGTGMVDVCLVVRRTAVVGGRRRRGAWDWDWEQAGMDVRRVVGGESRRPPVDCAEEE